MPHQELVVDYGKVSNLAFGIVDQFQFALDETQVGALVKIYFIQSIGSAKVKLVVEDNRRISRPNILSFRIYMLDSVIKGHEIHTIIQAKPKVFVFIGENAADIIILQAFNMGKALNQVSVFIYNMAAVEAGSESYPVIINHNGLIDHLLSKLLQVGRLKADHGFLIVYKESFFKGGK